MVMLAAPLRHSARLRVQDFVDLRTGSKSSEPSSACCPVVELRQYALQPGTRDRLIDLFEREFIETQEAVGISVIGHFRDLADPNRFVWLRGFPSMPSRKKSLEAFYLGSHWKAHRDAANATIIDNDNVLLLNPVRPNSGFTHGQLTRPSFGATPQAGPMVATLYYFDTPVDSAFVDLFDQRAMPELAAANANVVAQLTTDYSVNTFPALPVREGQHVFAWFALFAGADAYVAHRAILARSDAWATFSQELSLMLKYRAPEVLVLSPASRSLMFA
jgi:NIPSNAP